MPDELDLGTEPRHRTDVTVTVVHRFAVDDVLRDVAGGEWKVLKVGYSLGPWYDLEALNDVAIAEVRGTKGHTHLWHGTSRWIRREALRTIDRHFNPKS